jgi:uncharacterized protein YpmS
MSQGVTMNIWKKLFFIVIALTSFVILVIGLFFYFIVFPAFNNVENRPTVYLPKGQED